MVNSPESEGRQKEEDTTTHRVSLATSIRPVHPNSAPVNQITVPWAQFSRIVAAHNPRSHTIDGGTQFRGNVKGCGCATGKVSGRATSTAGSLLAWWGKDVGPYVGKGPQVRLRNRRDRLSLYCLYCTRMYPHPGAVT